MSGGRMDDRVVLVTGAARGIGLATARALHGRGARVAIGDVDREAAEAAASELGPGVVAFPVDVADPASIEAFVQAAVDQLGPLDVMVNNAGIMPIGPFVDEPHTLARTIVEINLLGVLAGTKVALRHLLVRGGGTVVNVASVAGTSPVPGGITYGATKAAVIAATESARVEFTGSGVSFTCVLPSFTDTELISGTSGTRFIRTATPHEVGEAVAAGIAHRRADVFVPALLGPVVRVQRVLWRSVRDRMNRLIGADRVFLEVDKERRRGYSERVGSE